jgi:hypothetical protein
MLNFTEIKQGNESYFKQTVEFSLLFECEVRIINLYCVWVLNCKCSCFIKHFNFIACHFTF